MSLKKNNINYRKILVPPNREERHLLRDLSGQSSVPVLIEVIETENQDDDIIKWVKKQK